MAPPERGSDIQTLHTDTARTFATNHFNRTFQALSNNVFIRADITFSALKTFLLNGLYKLTYLLTYLHPITAHYSFIDLQSMKD